MDGDRRGVGVERVAPDEVHELVAGERLAGVAGEEQQQLELALGERDLLGGDGHPARGRVDHELAELERRLRVGARVQAPQHGVDARHELGRRERLDDVVVGAQAQPDDAVGLLAARGQQDDRRAVAVVLAHAAHHLEPIDAGQHEVEHDEVGRALDTAAIAAWPSAATRVP